MTRWMHEERDINSMLPYLSEYMGHSSLEDTAYYIHLLPEQIPTSKFTDISGVFPEVPNDC